MPMSNANGVNLLYISVLYVLIYLFLPHCTQFSHDVDHIYICICGLMQYAMLVRTPAMNSLRQLSIRVLKLNVGPCW